jgi:hypothetical protein
MVKKITAAGSFLGPIGREERMIFQDIILACVVSFLVMCCLFPDLLVFHRVGFYRFSDTMMPYEGVFALVNNFFHGGIQLWDTHDQMPLAFQPLTVGMYSWTNVVTGMAFIFFAPFFSSPAEAFHVIYSVVYFAAPFIIRVAGIYLLLRRFCPDRRVLFFFCVFGNTIMVPHFFMGFGATECYGYFFLLAHFILRFFEEFKLRSLLFFGLIFTIAVSAAPLTSLEYFYLGIHFVILSALSWAVVFNRQKFLKAFGRLRDLVRTKERRDLWKAVIKIGLAVLVCLLIMGPNIHMLLANWHDYEFKAEASRFVDPHSIKAYFERPSYHAPQQEYFWRWLNYLDNGWDHSWLFLGFLSLVFVAAGSLVSRDNRKYIFLLALIFIWAINSPRTSGWLGGLAHWTNALTNPVKFLPRSFHMTGAFMSSLIALPLAALGGQALWDLFNKVKVARRDRVRVGLFVLVLGTVILIIFGKMPFEEKQYMARAALCLAILLISVVLRYWDYRIRLGILIACLLAILLNDGRAMYRYLKVVGDNLKVTAFRIGGLDQAGEASLDYLNPKVLPHRTFFSLSPTARAPAYIASDGIGMDGIFFQYTDLYKYLLPATNYTPRHISYAGWPGSSQPLVVYDRGNWPGDRELLDYLSRDHRIIYQADFAVPAGPGLMRDILNRGWDHRVVTIDAVGAQTEAAMLKGLPASLPEKKEPALEWRTLRLPLDKKYATGKGGLREFAIPLPEDFPAYLTTTIFTDDRSLIRAFLDREDSLELTPAQGKLVRPLTFDVNNYRTQALSVMLEKDASVDGVEVVLQYQQNERSGIVDIWKNEPDNFGFDYMASDRGWLVLHYPYDKRWRMKVDGKPAMVQRVNKSFIGVPISAGRHKVLLQYWPGTLLRPFIFVSFLVLIITLWGVTLLAIKEEPCRRSIS